MFPEAEPKETLALDENKINWFPAEGPVISDLLHGTHPTAVVGQHSLVTVPSDVIGFVMLQRLLTGSSFIVRCHLTSK